MRQLSIFLFFLPFLIFQTSLYAKKNFENWMGGLPQEIKKKRLKQILLPGTHESAAYKINYSKTIQTTTELSLVHMAMRIPSPIRSYIQNWTLTQKNDLYNQLTLGARYLDLRVSYHPQDKKFYLTHTFTLIDLKNALQQIKSFMDSHPEEVVIIALRPDYYHRKGMVGKESKIIQFIKNELTQHLQPVSSSHKLSDLTLEKIIHSQKRLIMTYPNSRDSLIWKGYSISEIWKDISDLKKRLDYITRTLKEIKSQSNRYYIVSMALTPDVNYVLSGIATSFIPFINHKGLKNLSNKVMKIFPDFLESNSKEFEKSTVIMVDYIQEDFIEDIIKFNLR